MIRKGIAMSKHTSSLRLYETQHPLLYEINIRILLTELSRAAGNRVTLARIPDRVLDAWSSLGFDAVWLMGVWATGEIGRELALKHPGLEEEYRKALPDLTPSDIVGSPYAVCRYEVSPELGGEKELARLRPRLAERGLGLVLDFVCNHTACDHPWTNEHPEYYIQGSADLLEQEPSSWFTVSAKGGERILAHGRDPMFPAWTDTAQLNHMHTGARRALIQTLHRISGLCDGVRCDMAMLVLRDVFLETWGKKAVPPDGEAVQTEFWSDTVTEIRKSNSKFLFLAEAYWDLEWALQQLGFDFTYDKRLYDRLRHEGAVSVREHLKAEMGYQKRSIRFIENHDEQRVAAAFSSEPWHHAAAVLMATIPGMAMFHEGQLDGRTLKVPVQLNRRMDEPVSERTSSFYRRLLACVSDTGLRRGEWRLLGLRPAWHDNPSWENFLAYCWHGADGCTRFIVVNYAPHSGQCYVDVPIEEVGGSPLEFRDLMSEAVFVRDRPGMASKGMYFDLPGYGFHIFSVSAAPRS
jgi:hypothetical protein